MTLRVDTGQLVNPFLFTDEVWTTPTTYDDFIIALNNGTLIPWMYYKFEYTPSWIDNATNQFTSWDTEKLVVLATSSTTYSPQAYSLNFEKDIVYWEHTPRTTTQWLDYSFNYLDWTLTSTGTWTINDIVWQDVVFLWNLPLPQEYVYFECYDTLGNYYWYFEWTRQYIEDNWFATFVDNNDWTYTMTVLQLDQTSWATFIPALWDFLWFYNVDYITNSTTGMIVRRETNKWLVADFDFRWVTQNLFFCDVIVDWATRVSWYYAPFNSNATIPIGNWGAVNLEFVVDSWDYTPAKIINLVDSCLSSSHLTGSDPFYRPWGNIFVNYMQWSNINSWWENVYIGRSMLNTNIQWIHDSLFMNWLNTSNVLWSMYYTFSERGCSGLCIEPWVSTSWFYLYVVSWLHIANFTTWLYSPNTIQSIYISSSFVNNSLNWVFYNNVKFAVPSITNKSIGALSWVVVDTTNDDWSFGTISIVSWTPTYTTYIS